MHILDEESNCPFVHLQQSSQYTQYFNHLLLFERENNCPATIQRKLVLDSKLCLKLLWVKLKNSVCKRTHLSQNRILKPCYYILQIVFAHSDFFRVHCEKFLSVERKIAHTVTSLTEKYFIQLILRCVKSNISPSHSKSA